MSPVSYLCLKKRSLGQVDHEVYCLAHGSNLVWKHIPQLCAGREFPSTFWSPADDRFRGFIKYVAADKSVLGSSNPKIFADFPCPSVLISILSKTVARINAVSLRVDFG